MEIIRTISGKQVEKVRVDRIAQRAFEKIMSELPEEVRTYDMGLYVVKTIEEKIKGSKIVL